jgi:hypothetical protein
MAKLVKVAIGTLVGYAAGLVLEDFGVPKKAATAAGGIIGGLL